MKKIVAFLLSACMLFSLVACSASVNETPSQTEPIASADTVYPVTLTDQAGRTVTLTAEPKRLVSSYFISTSALLALGLGERLVGIENSADKRNVYKLSAPEVLNLPNVGTVKEFNLEGCLALNPDLVILPLKLKSVVENLDAMGVTTILVNPESDTLLSEMMDLIGKACNVTPRAEAIHAFVAEQQAKLAAITGDTPSVYLGGNSNLLSTAGSEMFQSSQITLAGGQNVAADLTDDYWAEVSYEQLLAWNPEYIVLASDAVYSVEDVLGDPNLANCKAVQNGNVLHMPNDIESLDSPIPAAILGTLWLASELHPDVVTTEDFEEAYNTFYGEFYGITK